MTVIKSSLIYSLVVCAGLFGLAASGAPAHAQNVVASVNDDPVTNVDIEQHMRIQRVLRRPATREAALEAIFETRLKLIETSKFKINPNDGEIGQAVALTARELKMEPQQLLATLQRAGVTEDQIKQKWKAEAAWNGYVRALNRTLEVSENEVRGELARDGKARSNEYVLRQVTLVVPNNSGAGELQSRFKDAQALRAKFTDCGSGLEVVRNTRDAVINPPLTRSAAALSEPMRKLLDQTAIGHLTPPSRSAQGIDLIALCSKTQREDTSAAESVRSDLVTKRLSSESKRLYDEVRRKAIVVRK